MRVHIIQHTPFEGPASITNWCGSHDLTYTKTQLAQGGSLPELDQFDLLIVLGGPMGIHDQDEYPWLEAELEFIRACIVNNKSMLGICLGAQLIAHSLGATVSRNEHTEIGWFPVTLHKAITDHPLAEVFAPTFDAFHWHGDTFSIPDKAIPIASTEACTNQGYIYKDHIIGLQFHLETNYSAAQLIISNCRSELVPAPFIQSEDKMLSRPERFEHAQRRMFKVLDYLLAQTD